MNAIFISLIIATQVKKSLSADDIFSSGGKKYGKLG